MKSAKWIAVSYISLTCMLANASPETDAQASALLNSINMEQMFYQTIDKTLDIQLKQNPTLLPYKAVMLRFFKKYMSYESMKDEMVAIYSDAFTTQELKEMTDFYRTPTGKKAVTLMPELVAKGSELGTRRVQEHLSEFRLMMTDEANRLKNPQPKQ